jgi:hypothetical protein
MIKLLSLIIIFACIECLYANVMYSTNSPNCSISVEMDSDVYLSLEPIELNINLTNICSSELLFRESLFDKVEVNIVDSNHKKIKKTNMGNLLYFSNSMNAGKYSVITLEPGENLAFDMCLNQLFDLTVQDTYSVEMIFNIVLKDTNGLSYDKVKLTIPIKVLLPQNYKNAVLHNKIIEIKFANMSFLQKQKIYSLIENETCEQFKEQLSLKEVKNITRPIEALININSKKVQPILINNINFQVIENGQTNYPCFEALKETGVPFNTFTNELQNVDSESVREKLLHDLGSNLYGDIFQLYLDQYSDKPDAK